MSTVNPLDNLRDIHIPSDVSLWPPAPGWWILAVLVLLISFWTFNKLRAQHQKKQLFRATHTELDDLENRFQEHQDKVRLIKEYSILLRRVAIVVFSRDSIAALTGSQWLTFLDQAIDEQYFNSNAGRLLIQIPYRRESNTETLIEESDFTALQSAIHHWLETVTRPNFHPKSEQRLDDNV